MSSAGRLSKLFSANVVLRAHLSRRSQFILSGKDGISSSSSSSPSYAEPIGRRSSSTSIGSTSRCYSTSVPSLKMAKDISVGFKYPDDSVITVKGAEGDSLLDLVIDNNIDIDGFGACEGTLACSTCHLILSQEDYDRVPDQPTDEEFDMLDLAYGLTDTSRLGCQIFLTKDLDNFVVDVPPGIADARS